MLFLEQAQFFPAEQTESWWEDDLKSQIHTAAFPAPAPPQAPICPAPNSILNELPHQKNTLLHCNSEARKLLVIEERFNLDFTLYIFMINHIFMLNQPGHGG